MAVFYSVIYTTKDSKTHLTSFSDCWDNHLMRRACDYCRDLKKRDDVVSGHVYDEVGKKSFCSFDKEDL